MENLWIKLRGIYGLRWDSTHGHTVDPSGMWAATLHGLDGYDLAGGLSALVVGQDHKTFPPGAMEFRALCLPNAGSLGLPAEGSAYATFCSVTNTWSGGAVSWEGVAPAIYYTCLRIDQWALRHATGSHHRSIFVNAYRETVKEVGAGLTLPAVPKSIEHKAPPTEPRNEQNKVEATAELKAMRKNLGI